MANSCSWDGWSRYKSVILDDRFVAVAVNVNSSDEKECTIYWILHIHTSQTTVSLTRSVLPVEFEGLPMLPAVQLIIQFHRMCFNHGWSHINVIGNAVQSDHCGNEYFHSKFLKYLYWGADSSLGKNSTHVYVSTVT